ncbi:metallophosphoesterase [Heliophilum fasciatum]|uniref:Calcineurin-like phosphoesterase domain-containing protein n=1 Tax=Heliophilum fasciatum TaxID=35700 RepID=A0A4R2RUZ9_9FIRM|nr:metallophosphoesterase [Heliophilum fasciatum]MCW2277407.1 putative MPP superfamily phosphohydrolase [Heliophilum fasciatum]TCP67243.1 hypothetical protein EDD73_105141 [Heliophilum fasciatum]
MNQSPFYSVVRLFPLFFFLAVNYATYLAMCRWIPSFRGKNRTFYWFLAVLAWAPFLYSLASGFQRTEPWLRWLYYPALVWNLGQLIFLLLIPFVFLLIRWQQPSQQKVTEPLTAPTALPASLHPEPLPNDHVHKPGHVTRREWLQHTIKAVPLASLALATEGVIGGDTRIRTPEYTLALPALPRELDGLRIVHISDLHIGTFFPLHRLDFAFDLIADRQPDLLAITGDLIDDLTLLPETVRRFEQFTLPLGIHYCLGNHEHFRNPTLVRESIRPSRINLLDNSCSSIANGALEIVGVDYPMRTNGDSSAEVRKRYLQQALEGASPDTFKLLLTHHPNGFMEAQQSGIPLTLAGHTHGGQAGVGDRSLFAFAYPYMRGWYEEKGHHLFVHSGLGHWFPFRLGCAAEIVTIVLRSAKA